MSKPNWEKIKQYYISHPTEALIDVARRFKVKEATINWHSRKENWAEARKAFSQKVEAKFVEKTTEAEIENAKVLNKEHIKLYNKLMELVNLFMQEYINAKEAGKNNHKGATPANLAYLAEVIAKCQKGQRVALNMDSGINDNDESEVHVINGLDISKI